MRRNTEITWALAILVLALACSSPAGTSTPGGADAVSQDGDFTLSDDAQTLADGAQALADGGQTLTEDAQTLQDGLGEMPNGSCDGQSGAGTTTQGVDFVKQIVPILVTRCGSCHGVNGYGGLNLTAAAAYGDLVGVKSQLKPQLNLVEPLHPETSFLMMRLEPPDVTTSLMPPGAQLAIGDRDLVRTWILEGAKPAATVVAAADASAGGCGSDAADAQDAQSVDVTVADVAPLPTTCAANVQLPANENLGASMGPGQACIACHANSGEAPTFGIAGTVFDAPHMQDDCPGSGAATVTVTGAGGKTASKVTNSAGNFFFAPSEVPGKPYYVTVTRGGKVNAMVASPSSGDCNTCHTAAGANNAPGRILAP
jgi:mono/diheme cytochrome c family protein